MDNKFSINLAYLKKVKYFKNSDIADIIGMSIPTVGNLIKGNVLPNSDTLLALSKEFGCTVDDLLKTDLSKKPKNYDNKDYVPTAYEEVQLPPGYTPKIGKVLKPKTPIEDVVRETIEYEVAQQNAVLKSRLDRIELLLQIQDEIHTTEPKKTK